MAYHYEILAHPADIKLKVVADKKEELFLGALKGMAGIIYHSTPQEEKNIIKEKLEVSSAEIDILLIDFLSDVLTKSDIHNAIFNEIEIKELKEDFIKAEIRGKKIEKFDEEIKAVTYHGLKIKQNEKGEYEAEILFDV